MDGRGVPLSLVVVGANRHGAKMSFRNVTQVAAVLGGKIIEQGDVEDAVVENLCADKAYDSAEAKSIMVAHDYVPHVRSRGEEIESKERNPDYKARRWVIEVSHIRKCFSRVGITCFAS